MPDEEGKAVRVNGTKAQFWEAEEPYTEAELKAGKESSNGGLYHTIPGTKYVNTLAWQDPDTWVYFRLQSIQDQDMMVHIAENVKHLPLPSNPEINFPCYQFILLIHFPTTLRGIYRARQVAWAENSA